MNELYEVAIQLPSQSQEYSLTVETFELLGDQVIEKGVLDLSSAGEGGKKEAVFANASTSDCTLYICLENHLQAIVVNVNMKRGLEVGACQYADGLVQHNSQRTKLRVDC